MSLKEPEELIRPDDRLLSRRGFRDHISRYYFASQHVASGSVLDVACGSGYGTAYLVARGAYRVIGGDISRQAIGLAKRYYQNQGAECALMDCTRLPFRDGAFDTVVSIETLEHLVGQQDFLMEIVRVLRPEGVLVLSTPNKDVLLPGCNKPLWPFHIKEFRPEELCSLLSQFFHEVALWGQRPIQAGNRRTGQLLGDFLMILKGILKRLPAGGLLAKLVTTFWLRDFYPVDITKVERFEAEAGYLETAYPLDTANATLTFPTVILVVARRPKK